MKTDLSIYLKSYVLALVAILIMDGLWLPQATPWLYGPAISKITKLPQRPIRLIGGIVAWSLMAFVIIVYNIYCVTNLKQSFYGGIIIGLVLYGVYNSTNYAIFKEWNLKVCFYDTLWGIILMTSVSVLIGKYLGRHWK